MDLTQPRLLSVKYWHDKTVNTHGWWRMLPLVGLATAAVATVVFWLGNSLLTLINDYKERQQEEAALDTLRAAVDPTYEQAKSDFSWIGKLASFVETPESTVDDNEKTYGTLKSGMTDTSGLRDEYFRR